MKILKSKSRNTSILKRSKFSIIVTYRYRLYPNEKQKTLLAKTFGCVRFVWNYFLAWREQRYKEEKLSTTEPECRKHLNSVLKEQYPWLREVDKFALENALINLDNAYKIFFKKQARCPKFKTKKSHRFSYTTNSTNNNIQVDFGEIIINPDKSRCWGKIKLPKLGWVKARIHRTFDGRIKSATVTLTPSGRYYVSITVEQEKVYNRRISETPQNFAIALDLGVKDLYVDSQGKHIENPKILARYEKRIKKLQRELARKVKGSKNFEKIRIKLARMHERVTNIRKDFLEKLSSQVVSENQAIICEDLRVKNLVRNSHLTKSIHDVSWSKFVEMVRNKAERYGRVFLQVSPSFPSSQICSKCGHKNEGVKELSVRTWKCPKCGMEHDRDENAAKNILRQGLLQLGIT
ncbi:MAG: IS200/IS605 family element RNA-guided endonuclease TnpB [Fervidobacterium sp.]|uniref:Putative transposase n=4 Tax=Fervidobacterium gondwanense TaxID=44754 RepID=A0A1M7TC79_FERGO|nr:IS200/IS605 family element RNA-guided endonuclease TnpB [Fervidobacterium gondwanense]SHN68281.1 putative transposase [Fervidobacterium gondwanense DSM 13020]